MSQYSLDLRQVSVIVLFLVFSSVQSQVQEGDIAQIWKLAQSLQADVSDFTIIFKQDLEETPVGPYTINTFNADWNNPPWGTYSAERTVIKDYDLGGRSSRGMEWVFPEGTFSQNADYGYQWRPPLGGAYYECYLSYSIMFKPGFEPVLGGKLPCLMGYPFNGDQDYNHGYYAGIMFKEGPKPVFYLYHHDMRIIYGETRFWNYTFDVSTDIWYDITLRVVMNSVSDTSGNYDGIIEGYVNGELVGQWTGLRLRNFSNIGTDAAVIQAFFGGNSQDWATIRDEWMIVDNVFVWKYSDQYLAENPQVPRGNRAGSFGDQIITPMDVFEQFPDPGTGSDLQPPTTPNGLAAVNITQESISINWNPSSDNVGVTGYNVFKDGIKVSSSGTNSFTVLNLEPATQYALSVSAYDAAANVSPRSTAIYLSTSERDTEPPTVPTSVRVGRISGYSIELSWDPSQDNVGVNLYEIQLNDQVTAFVPSTSHIAGGLSPGTDYKITVRALDRAGNSSPFSSPVYATTGDADNQAPTKPTGLKSGIVTSASIGLSWNPSTDNVAVKGYKIFVNNQIWEESSSTDEILTGLGEGITYTIVVIAFDEAANESPKSDAIQVTTTNEDITTTPTLPEVSILNVDSRSRSPKTVSELKSLGFTNLDAYGIVVTQGNQPIEEGSPIFAQRNESVVERNARSESGLLVLYNFLNNEGTVVSDISGVGEPLDLYINKPLNTTWLPGPGLRVTGNTTLTHIGLPSKVISGLKATNEITLEAWVKQEEIEQAGSIITLSNNISDRAVNLGHAGNKAYFNYDLRLTTTATDPSGTPGLTSTLNFTSRSLHHVVYTRDSQGTEILYVNGLEMSRGNRGGDFSIWKDSYNLVLANELTGDRPWNGILYLVAIYNRALDKQEVDQNFEAGFGKILYSTDLSSLSPNTTYAVVPFVRTDQGVVYGQKWDFIYENVLYSNEQDSIYLAIYPNPSNGNFRLFIEFTNTTEQPALLRIADMSGQVIYSKELEASTELVSFEEELVLSSQIVEGIYSVIVIMGNQSVARRLIIHQ